MITAFQKFTSWVNSKIWTVVDYDKMYGAQCVDFAREYAASTWNPIGAFGWSAYSWWESGAPFKGTKWKRCEKLAKSVPSAWDIIFFAPTKNNKWWHVAVVDGQCTPFKLNIIEQNAGKGDGSGKWSDAVKRSSLTYDARGKCVGWYTLG